MMNLARHLVLQLSILWAATVLSAYAQQERWIQNPTNGHWYTSTASGLTWANAEAEAVQLGGHLATVRSSSESEWLTTRLPQHWIGLHLPSPECGAIQWTSGEPVFYTNLCDGSPSCGFVTSLASCPSTTCWFTFDDSLPGIAERAVEPPMVSGGWSCLQILPGAAGAPPTSRARLANLNGDAVPDVVDSIGTTLVRRLGANYPVGLQPASSTTIPFTATSIHAADLDDDGLDDLLLGRNPEVRVLRNSTSGTLTPLSPVFLGGTPIGYAAARLDNDTHLDVAVITSNQRLRILQGDGTGELSVIGNILLPTAGSSLCAGDLDDDGDIDLLVAAEITGEFMIWPNAGDGTFGNPTTLLRGFYPHQVELADMDQDGRLDIVTVGDWNGWKAQVLRRIGPNHFSPLAPVTVSANIRGIQVADMDGNGIPDLFLDADAPQVLLTNISGNLSISATFNRLLGSAFAMDVESSAGLELVGLAGACSTTVVYSKRFATDCNQNGIQDQAEILAAPTIDLDADGVIDSCEAPGIPYCFGDGSGAACPCDPGQSGSAGGGCRNSFGGTGTLGASGNASVSLDSVTLRATGFLPSGIGLLFQGNSQQAGGFGGAFGDGLLCVNQSVVRITLRNATAGVIAFGRDVPGDPSVALAGQVPAIGGVRHYQIWYRDPAPFCTASTFNLTNGVTIAWLP